VRRQCLLCCRWLWALRFVGESALCRKCGKVTTAADLTQYTIKKILSEHTKGRPA